MINVDYNVSKNGLVVKFLYLILRGRAANEWMRYFKSPTSWVYLSTRALTVYHWLMFLNLSLGLEIKSLEEELKAKPPRFFE